MRNIWAIYRRELNAYFNSPIAYVVLAFFIFIYGYFFHDYLYRFMQFGLQMSQYGGARTLNVNQDLIRWLFHSTSVVVLFMLPLITMRSFAEEKRSGTIELLLTSPVTDLQIVLGKFLAAWTLYAAMLGLTLIHMGMLFIYGDPEWTAYPGRLSRHAPFGRDLRQLRRLLQHTHPKSNHSGFPLFRRLPVPVARRVHARLGRILGRFCFLSIGDQTHRRVCQRGHRHQGCHLLPLLHRLRSVSLEAIGGDT